MSLTYRAGRAAATPVVCWWGRLTVEGLPPLAGSGPMVLVANHDSAWDPVIIGVAAHARQVRALAKSSLWATRPFGWLLDRMGQIPIQRGRGDLTALSAAVSALQGGACVSVFPEGTVSRGRALPAHSGAGRLALAVPHAQLLCVAVTGAVDLVRFPRRPRIRVQFFPPTSGPPRTGERPLTLARRAMSDIRDRAPHATPGRPRKAARFRRLAADYHSGRRRNQDEP
jgi:1-acyl-sn-glycerol-3-phosphate acyltransferase